ncbi:sodium:alanine symporter family protein [Glycomyces sp. TRM65418]|uniref:alanine/glycine:cation symporter family protein n=1 Tax=Glycomyces sp. TRM65418 TaxID=2867006 RepID=UPI001CE699EF|nr:sodium:alanine symporter family protein [Glycomyces sp. TRM65418]MCC3764561.1 sodium:alanine symporter family protein [Glycomyces sp. TRM65418]QZD54228.1 sodium:alanine symporter family protein [Glycomyces sp. TRM65418]
MDFLDPVTEAIQSWADGLNERYGSAVGSVVDVVWGPILIFTLFAVGLIFTIVLRGVQFRRLGYGLWLALFKRKENSESKGDLSHYQALSVALAATVGVGNIGGVGAAIAIGGPGALFWMWVTGFLGMATKYSEALLGVKFRVTNEKGEQSGGPQQYLSQGIRGPLGKVLAIMFAVFGVVASFGIGNAVQSGNVTSALDAQLPADSWWTPELTGLVIFVLVGVTILGGIKWIGNVAAALVPLMIVFYVLGALAVLAFNWDVLGTALVMVFEQAFTGGAAVGGFTGSTIMLAIQMGFARGIFSNESGLGTGGIAAAAAKTDQPVRQALVSMTQTFIDTIIVVSLTGLVIISTGVLGAQDEEGELVTSAALTRLAFEEGLGGSGTTGGAIGGFIVAVGLATFAFSTIIGWSYYGEKCLERFTGRTLILPYRILYVLVTYLGAVTSLDLLWGLSDIANGLMALPNLIGLLILTPLVYRETKAFFARPDWRLLPSNAVEGTDDPPTATHKLVLADEPDQDRKD